MFGLSLYFRLMSLITAQQNPAPGRGQLACSGSLQDISDVFPSIKEVKN